MPLYEYECEACGHRIEIIQKFSDGPPDACPKCSKGPLVRRLSSPAIQFKGTGWYVTDYAGKGRSGPGDSSAESSKKGETTKSDSAPSESGGSTETKKGGSTETKKADTPTAPATSSKD